MNQHKTLFLEALKASLTNTTVTWTTPLTNEEWQSLFALAESHKVLTLIFHAVYSCPAAAQMDQQLFASTKRRTLTLTLNQVQKTAEFLSLYEKLQKECDRIEKKVQTLKKDAIFFEDAILFQEDGLYTPRYNFITAEESYNLR